MATRYHEIIADLDSLMWVLFLNCLFRKTSQFLFFFLLSLYPIIEGFEQQPLDHYYIFIKMYEVLSFTRYREALQFFITFCSLLRIRDYRFWGLETIAINLTYIYFVPLSSKRLCCWHFYGNVSASHSIVPKSRLQGCHITIRMWTHTHNYVLNCWVCVKA